MLSLQKHETLSHCVDLDCAEQWRLRCIPHLKEVAHAHLHLSWRSAMPQSFETAAAGACTVGAMAL